MESMVPVCPLISTRSDVMELCVGERCAWYVAPVRKCTFYVLGHKSAVELQNLQKEFSTANKGS